MKDSRQLHFYFLLSVKVLFLVSIGTIGLMYTAKECKCCVVPARNTISKREDNSLNPFEAFI